LLSDHDATGPAPSTARTGKATASSPVSAGDRDDHPFRLAGGDERDDATAEPRAREAGAVRTRLDRKRHEEVELGGGDREVAGQRTMTLERDAPERGEVALSQALDEARDPFVLAHDVARDRVARDLVRRRVAQ
jgi:hypothetical protein